MPIQLNPFQMLDDLIHARQARQEAYSYEHATGSAAKVMRSIAQERQLSWQQRRQLRSSPIWAFRELASLCLAVSYKWMAALAFGLLTLAWVMWLAGGADIRLAAVTWLSNDPALIEQAAKKYEQPLPSMSQSECKTTRSVEPSHVDETTQPPMPAKDCRDVHTVKLISSLDDAERFVDLGRTLMLFMGGFYFTLTGLRWTSPISLEADRLRAQAGLQELEASKLAAKQAH
jgi:hypothetical protein